MSFRFMKYQSYSQSSWFYKKLIFQNRTKMTYLAPSFHGEFIMTQTQCKEGARYVIFTISFQKLLKKIKILIVFTIKSHWTSATYVWNQFQRSVTLGSRFPISRWSSAIIWYCIDFLLTHVGTICLASVVFRPKISHSLYWYYSYSDFWWETVSKTGNTVLMHHKRLLSLAKLTLIVVIYSKAKQVQGFYSI